MSVNGAQISHRRPVPPDAWEDPTLPEVEERRANDARRAKSESKRRAESEGVESTEERQEQQGEGMEQEDQNQDQDQDQQPQQYQQQQQEEKGPAAAAVVEEEAELRIEPPEWYVGRTPIPEAGRLLVRRWRTNHEALRKSWADRQKACGGTLTQE